MIPLIIAPWSFVHHLLPLRGRRHWETEALIEEARQRHRRRRRWIGLVLLVLALIVSVSLVATEAVQDRRRLSVRTTQRARAPRASRPGRRALQRQRRILTGSVFEVGSTGPSSGWAMGEKTLYFTSDMGRTWRAATMPPYFSGRSIQELVTGVAAVGQSNLWVAVGDVIGAVQLTQPMDGSVREDGVIHSSNGGSTWTFATLPGCLQSCSGISVSFVDALHGFAAASSSQPSETRLFSTEDGGTTWRAVSTLPGDEPGIQISFTNLEDGWAVTPPAPTNSAEAGNAVLHIDRRGAHMADG